MPAGARLRCQKCGKQFTRAFRTSRLNCYECVPERISAKVTQLPSAGEEPQEEGRLTKSSREQLEEWGVLGTWQADAVLTIAIAIDAGKGGGSAGLAGAIKAHREAMQVAHDIAQIEQTDNVTSIFQDSV